MENAKVMVREILKKIEYGKAFGKESDQYNAELAMTLIYGVCIGKEVNPLALKKIMELCREELENHYGVDTSIKII